MGEQQSTLVLRHLRRQEDQPGCLQGAINQGRLARHGYSADNRPTGAVVSIANLTECWSIGRDYQSGMPLLYNGADRQDKCVSLKEDKFSYYSRGRYAWKMSDVQRISETIPAKGQ